VHVEEQLEATVGICFHNPQSFITMSRYILKRKAVEELSNTSVHPSKQTEICSYFCKDDFLPILNETIHHENKSDKEFTRNYQNVHPILPWYNDLQTSHVSYEDFLDLTNPDHERKMYEFLTDVGLIPSFRKCQFCGNNMRIVKDKSLFWICTRRVNGVKCNRGKRSIRDGTIFDGAMLSTQTILTILWHFVHQLNESQCSQYTKISDKNHSSIVKWYKFACRVCTEWINDSEHTPKLGGYGKIVEFDESFFPGKPKYNTISWS